MRMNPSPISHRPSAVASKTQCELCGSSVRRRTSAGFHTTDTPTHAHRVQVLLELPRDVMRKLAARYRVALLVPVRREDLFSSESTYGALRLGPANPRAYLVRFVARISGELEKRRCGQIVLNV